MTLPNISISQAQPADKDAVARLLVVQLEEHQVQRQIEELVRVIDLVLADERNGFLFVARRESEVIGVAYVATLLSAEHGGWVGSLEELYISPEFRGQGIGTALLQSVTNRSRELGFKAIELEVDIDHKRAEPLYTRFGFRKLPRARWLLELS